MAKIKRLRYETDDEYIRRASQELYANGSHVKEIVEKLKCTEEEVYNAVVAPKHRITTPEERDAIIRMVNGGYTFAEVARILGKSSRCVRNRYKTPAKRAKGGKEYELTDKELTKLKSLFEEGRTLNYIARELNISVKAVRWRLKKAGLYVSYKYRVFEISPKEIKKYKSMFKKGYTPQQICMEFGRPFKVVYKCLQSEGLL